MVSDADHIRASAETLRRGLLKKLEEIDREKQEITEMLRTVGEAPRVITGATSNAVSSEGVAKKPVKYNLDLSKHVDTYLDSYPWKQAINIKDMIKILKAEYGVTGKDASLYAYIHSLLKKWSDDPSRSLKYEKGVGFFKSRGEDKESVLVATV